MKWRCLRQGCALLAVACSAAFAADGAPWDTGRPRETAAPQVGDVLYRSALFHYYQQQVFAALGSLTVSQQQARLGTHAAEAEWLRGGLLLGHGLPDEAATVFSQLGAQPALQDRAWYFLALAWQQRGGLAQAEEALSRIRGPLPGTLQTERLLLQAQLLTARHEHAAAATRLEAASSEGGDSSAARVARYNLAVALLQQAQQAQPGLRQRGLALLDALGQQPAADEEQLSLRDRANLARGYAALQDQQPREARVALQRVRLQGLQANKALLGYGWAAVGLNDPRLALVPWQELSNRPDADAAVLEARLAVPYALGEIGAFAGALQGYQQAAAGYEQAQRALADTLTAVREGRLIDVNTAPSAALPAPLLPLLASHRFHEGLKNLRDLQFASSHAQQWLHALDSFEDALTQRRKAFAERLPQVLAQRGAVAIAQLQQQRDALAAEVARAEQAADGRAYANAKEHSAMDRLQRARAALRQVTDAQLDAPLASADAATAASIARRLRLAEGALTWQLAQALPARAGQAKQALQASDATLLQARAHEAALSAAQQREPARQAAFAQRMAELRLRLLAIAPQVLALSGEQQQELQALAVEELQQQQERLKVYAAQAQLGMAQVQDAAQFARQNAASSAASSARAPR